MRRTLIIVVAASLLTVPAARADMGEAGVAAPQVALARRALCRGPGGGSLAPSAAAAARRLQKRSGISVAGVPGPQTRSALGRYSRYELGERTLERGMAGWDVGAVQFLLAWHGFPSGPF